MSDTALPPALRFLLAARRCELEALQNLVSTCGLVTMVGQLVHDLQKERGYSNIYLSCPGKLRLEILDSFSASATHSEDQVRHCLEGIDTDISAGGARLFNHIAHALHVLDSLPRLRRRVREQTIATSDSTSAFTQLIGSLLAVVFEAADAALGPVITRALVAMFNFMQGKELTGQERAIGVAAFSAGYFDSEQHEQVRLLRERQQRCFKLFVEHADDSSQQQWENMLSGEAVTRLEQLRLIGLSTSVRAPVDTGLGELWFDVCTQHINAMKEMENALAEDLLQHCRHNLNRVRAELGNRRNLARQLAAQGGHPHPVLFRVQAGSLDSPSPDGIGMQMHHSILDNMHTQAERLQQLDDEIRNTRAALEERRRSDCAKRMLMKRFGLSEQDAHEYLLRHSMQSGRRLSAVIDEVLDRPDLFRR